MNVKWFVLGVVATLVALSAAAYIYVEKGFVNASADIQAGALDSWLGSAMDASTARHAPKMTNPIPDTRDALLAGAKIYSSQCSICHGSPSDKESILGGSFNPPAPQFFGDDPPDMAENENYYIIKHGVRMTAMPAWSKLLNEEQIWQMVDLLKHVNDKNLPPEVTQELNQPETARQ